MPSLSRELRRLLERTIAGKDGARQIAEDGAEQSLQRLAVDRHEPHGSLTPEERTLRNQLRARGRQLGDKLDPQRGGQTINHLKQAVAYEHWHRLLFARFLAENDLLMHPEHGVALSLDEVKELALGSGRDWIELASDYAQRMLLREVFRSDDPGLRVPLSPEKRRDLEAKLNLLPREIFLADDSLGWVYQFWQKDAKDVVNLLEVKIGADELAPVTQLFTEDYMVLFLLENTLGAWWTARRGSPDLPSSTWTYLRLNEDGTPTAGSYYGWPKSAKELRVLDPCMGSGHFLTFALPILARMRETEEGLSITDAIAAVLRDNLFGLELDPRCSQIAAFNLALTAWKLAGSHFELPPLNLACSGLGINAKEEDWVMLAGEDGLAAEGMRRLYSLFKDAPTLGSLIDPLRLKTNVFSAGTESILPMLEEALKSEASSEEARELVIAAQGVLAAFRMLASHFTLVVTNVPYLGRGKQSHLLSEYCGEFHSSAKADLATCFVDRCLRFCSQGGSVALVTPQNWLYLTSYTKLRHELLSSETWNIVARLGPKAFQTPMWDFNVALVGLTRCKPAVEHKFAGWDVGETKTPGEKAIGLMQEEPRTPPQSAQLKSPGHVITFESAEYKRLLAHYAKGLAGILNGDTSRFEAFFWEVEDFEGSWEFEQSTVEASSPYAGREKVILWEKGSGQLRSYAAEVKERLHDADRRGNEAWGKWAVAISQMRHLPATLSSGEKFDTNVAVILPLNPDHLLPIWAFCSSTEYAQAVRRVSQKLNVTNATLVKVEFDLDHWQRIATNQYPAGPPKPGSSDPTQWLLSGHPNGSDQPLLVSVARLVGYCWPRQAGFSFPDCPALERDGLEVHASPDGIVCLSSVAGGENAAARLRDLLQTAFGEDYNLAQLLNGKKSSTLESWLRDEFFQEQCQIFHHRPFVWHIWDGLKDGFHALVNYHKLDRKNLEKLIFSYLGDWLTRQRQDVQNGVEGADTRLAAAEHLQGELKKILEGEKPYDIFVRWKPLDKQPIGWEPDLNDGVRMNIRPWITEAKLYKATKPGILRVTPNIKYTKDRGKEPARDPKQFPWFAKSTDRVNDVHLSLNEKRRARGLR
jgi:hypothetical protein